MKKIYNYSLIKKISTTVLFVVMVFVAPSCKKFTDLQPKGALSTVTGFSTTGNVSLAAAGMYNSASVGTYNGGAGRGYAFGAASIEQGEMRGEDMVNIAAFYQITYEATYDPTTANNVNMWINLYQLINQANTFIDGVHLALSKNVISSTDALTYEGEARFLRALAHHELLIQFCRPYLDGNGAAIGVPYRTIAVNSQDAVTVATKVPRGTVADDYTALLADLDYAETNLPATRATNNITRATKGAAIALKTRVKLHKGDWAGVIADGAKLGTGAATGPYTSPIGNYRLTASPDGPFYSGLGSISPANNASNTESIFSIENSSTANGGVNGALPNMFGIADRGGRNLVCTSPNLYNASFWVNSDTRRSVLQIQQNVANQRYFFNFKYRDITTLSDYAPIIRYAEVLLNVAEAYSRTGASANALSLLNAVRNRAVAVADQYTIATAPVGLTLTRAILNERRIEFAGEGRRWSDIHRLAVDPDFSTGGIPGKITIAQINGAGTGYNIVTRPVITPSVAPLPYSNFHFLWPVPATEIANNPTITQNPGY